MSNRKLLLKAGVTAIAVVLGAVTCLIPAVASAMELGGFGRSSMSLGGGGMERGAGRGGMTNGSNHGGMRHGGGRGGMGHGGMGHGGGAMGAASVGLSAISIIGQAAANSGSNAGGNSVDNGSKGGGTGKSVERRTRKAGKDVAQKSNKNELSTTTKTAIKTTDKTIASGEAKTRRDDATDGGGKGAGKELVNTVAVTPPATIVPIADLTPGRGALPDLSDSGGDPSQGLDWVADKSYGALLTCKTYAAIAARIASGETALRKVLDDVQVKIRKAAFDKENLETRVKNMKRKVKLLWDLDSRTITQNDLIDLTGGEWWDNDGNSIPIPDDLQPGDEAADAEQAWAKMKTDLDSVKQGLKKVRVREADLRDVLEMKFGDAPDPAEPECSSD